jgi:hypothetical protein
LSRRWPSFGWRYALFLHQGIAAELGNSREVTSWILEDFSALGMVEISRGSLKILDREAFQTHSVV